MTTLSPGDRVTLTIGGRLYRGTVLYVRGTSVRVRLEDGRERTVDASRVKPAKKATMWVSRTADDPAALIAAGVCEVTHVDHEKRTVTVDLVPHLRPVPKPPKPLRSQAYLRFVASRPCCVCDAPAPNEAHHFGPRGMGEKTDDYRTVALCTHHHREFHDHGVCRGWSRERTEKVFAQAMVTALYEWLPSHGHDDDLDTIIVDALIAHIRESAA